MGYTHYLENKPAFTDAQWVAFCRDVRKLFKGSKIPVANGHGTYGTKPVFKNEAIYFNGVGDDSYETCCIYKRAEDFECCKTARKPYDKLVVAVYKLVRKYLPETKLSSDGGDAVFGNVVVVEAPNGKRLTYSAGSHKVKIGDRVILPEMPYGDGGNWEAEVVATESDYEGVLKEIEGLVKEKRDPATDILQDAIECIIRNETDARLNIDVAAEEIVALIKWRLKI